MIFDDGRVQRLAAHVAAWSVLWIVILQVVPAGASKRNHIISLNAAHGVVCTLTAVLTIQGGYDSTNAVAVSLSYFLVDLAAMVQSDGLRNLPTLNRSRKMDYVHHVLGLLWGFVFFVQEATVCDAHMGNPYVWIQTNEVSTPFYNWFRLTDNKLAGALFVLTFFGSRIVFNTAFLIPQTLRHCDARYLVACIPFFALQYMWFVMIVKKMARTLKKPALQVPGSGFKVPGPVSDAFAPGPEDKKEL
uniref:TLC domain-containing protein n=1 Tax=Globisporangium ultimum (strain ATCC 200006 / CBS 805.95 / DAOM BR144) TaxID=431595 RepID=K3WYK4_GLOUD